MHVETERSGSVPTRLAQLEERVLASGDSLDVHAPPFNRNPSAWSQRIPIALIASVGVIIATYLAMFQWGLIDSVWEPFFGKGTERVLKSNVSGVMHRWIGVPDGALGAFGYLGDAVLGMTGSTRRWQYRPWMVLLFGLDVIPLGVTSAVLVFMQAFVVGYWCTLCLVSAVVSLVLVPFAYDEVWATLKYLQRVWKATHDRKILWRVFWGGYAPEADAVALKGSV